jgi:mannose-1-phosphate guanylyltransferase
MIFLSGEDVAVEDEVVVVNCIVLPHKTITSRVQDEIIL